MKSVLVSLAAALILLWGSIACADSPPPKEKPGDANIDEGKADHACRQGLTIYCLALGMAEERIGQKEKALEHYRLACENHHTPGHLRACTPLLALAREMNRLNQAAVPLEKKCREGSAITCFYLGKEYLKILEFERATAHLDPLCRSDYQPPDPQDYGPCYHLAKGLEGAGNWDQARELYTFDCERSPEKGQPSCAALEALAILQKKMVQQPWSRTRDWEWVEAILLVLVTVPVAALIAWVRRSPKARGFVLWGAPSAILVLWGLWEGVPKQYIYHPADRILIAICLIWSVGLALMGRGRFNVEE